MDPAYNPQHYLFPADLFPDQPAATGRPWVCARTRSRHEKHLCDWLRLRGIAHFLPTARAHRRSGRTCYTVDAPLFPGYVFLVGGQDKAALREARCVVDVLRPPVARVEQLERDLWTIWRGLATGSRLEVARKLIPGEVVEITAPPYAGMRGRFERWGRHGRLLVWLDIMGCGAIIELSEIDVDRVC